MSLQRFHPRAIVERAPDRTTWEAVDRRDRILVSISVHKLQRGASTEHRRAAILAEAHTLASLHHRHVISVYDAGLVAASDEGGPFDGVQTGAPFIVHERFFGAPIDQLAFEDWRTLYPLVHNILQALAHVHGHGLVHSQVVPRNLLVRSDRSMVKLTGFDSQRSAQASDDPELVSTLAPEQLLLDTAAIGPWTDLFGVGAVVWRLLTGASPFQASESERQTDGRLRDFTPRFEVPDRLEPLLRRLLLRDPAKRPHYAAEVRQQLFDLERSTGPTPVTAQRRRIQWRELESSERRGPTYHGGLSLIRHREVPIRGRDRERDRLWDALTRTVATRQPHVVVVRGGSGSGVSSLIRWVGTAGDMAGLADRVFVHHEHSPARSHGMLAALARTWGVDLQQADPIAISDRLVRDVRSPLRVPIAVELSRVLVREHRDDYEQALLVDVLAARAARRPQIVVVDDAHLGLATLDLIERVQARSQAPILFVLGVRSEDLDARPAARDTLEALVLQPSNALVDLEPLESLEIAQLLQDVAPLDPELVAELAEASRGRPAVALRVLRLWAWQGRLVLDEDGYRTPRDQPGSQAAGRTAELARLGRLPMSPSQQRMLEYAALAGDRIHVDAWNHLCATAGLRPDEEWIERMIRYEVVRRDGPFLHFFDRATVDVLRETFHRSRSRD